MTDAQQTTPRRLRIFLSSPGDVADERNLARNLLRDELPFDPLLRRQIEFDVVSWDDPASPTPMPATITPQEAVNRFGPKPSDCDVVVVILWSRLGTHLDVTAFHKEPGGEPYLSGTEWEFEDAWNAQQRPEILVYQRTEEPKVGLRDPDLEEKRRQYDRVVQFLERFKNPDGSFRGGWTPYTAPSDFKARLANDLKYLLQELLSRVRTEAVTGAVPVWTGPPYPGLRSFTSEQAAIFFGRGREEDALISRLRDPGQRFLAVVGTSGVGKSSLVRAGLLPRLMDGAIEGSPWKVLTCAPGATGDNPFLSLAVELAPALPTREWKPPVEIAQGLATSPQRLTDYAATILSHTPTGSALVLFIDQLEELFTAISEAYRAAFIELLACAASNPRLRVVVTLRADFLPRCANEPALAALLQAGTFVLGPPGAVALAEMIRKPADHAGLELEDGLVDEILKDAGYDPGALPLVAFSLEELYRQSLTVDHVETEAQRTPPCRLTIAAYNTIGRLHGAIGRRAETLLEDFRQTTGVALDTVLSQVFRTLVHVDAAGAAARRRAFRKGFRIESVDLQLIEALVERLIQGRLLLAEYTRDQPTVILAHEVLFVGWPTLRDWLDRNRIQLQRLQRLLSSVTAPGSSVDGFVAVEELGKMGPAAAEAVPALITALGDAEPAVRSGATHALGRIGAAAVPALISALGDAEREVRYWAAHALGQIRQAAEALPALSKALKDPSEKDYEAAKNVLKTFE
jgi:hypothetical protein